MSYLHLVPGSAVLPGPDRLLLVTADERFAAITGTPAELTEIADVLRGVSPIPEAGTGAEVAAAVVDWQAGATAPAPRVVPAGWRLGEVVPEALVRAGLAALPGLADADLAVVAGDVLDDARLRAFDHTAGDRCWVPVHRELGALVVGPVLNRRADNRLTWADVRFRRLAASPARPELVQLWDTWTAHGTAHDLVPTADAGRDAGTRLLDWLASEGGLLASHQVVVPFADAGAPSTHPVLPVPRGLMERLSA